jgi:hypothetical protein
LAGFNLLYAIQRRVGDDAFEAFGPLVLSSYALLAGKGRVGGEGGRERERGK